MMITLLKKQIAQTFSFLTMDSKKGQARSAGKIALLAVVFAFCFIAVAAMVFGLAGLLLQSMLPMNLDWLYFIYLGFFSVGICVIGSVFSTYSSLYRAKDNELLLSLPVKPWMIVVSRVLSVFLMGLIFALPVWGSGIVQYAIQAGFNGKALFCQIVLLFVIVLISLCLTCLLGWLVALIASRMKHKNFAVTALSLFAFGLYYYAVFNSEKLIGVLVQNAAATGDGIAKGVPWLHAFGLASLGGLKATGLWTAVALILGALCFLILIKTFTRIVTLKTGNATKVYVEKKTASKGVRAALLNREFKRLAGFPTYMLNCALGTLFIPALTVFLLVKLKDLEPLLGLMNESAPEIGSLLPLVLMGLLSLLAVFNDLTAPSISLEAKTLWIPRSLPIRTIDFLDAKQGLHLILTLPVTALACVVLSIVLKINALDAILTVIFCLLFICFGSAFGLTLNLKMPNLNWPTETAAVKSGAAVALAIFGQWAILIVLGIGCFFACKVLPARVVMLLAIALIAAATAALNLWIRKKGVFVFENLKA